MAKVDTPTKVALNLDTLEREGAPEPLAVVIGGKRYFLQDPQECDFRELIEVGQAGETGDWRRAVELMVPEADRKTFFENKLPNFKLEALYKLYNEHFSIPTSGEAEGSAS